jgi:hypothetical protein
MGIPQPPEKPHNDGIPPLTDKYKDPAYTESRTRSGGPAIVNETVLLILVNYSDVSPSRTVPELESAVFNTTSDVSSVHNFYLETSYGVCNVTPGYLNGRVVRGLNYPRTEYSTARIKPPAGTPPMTVQTWTVTGIPVVKARW